MPMNAVLPWLRQSFGLFPSNESESWTVSQPITVVLCVLIFKCCFLWFRGKQHLILSTDRVQLNGKLRLGGRMATMQGRGERVCGSAAWPSWDYFRAGYSSAVNKTLIGWDMQHACGRWEMYICMVTVMSTCENKCKLGIRLRGTKPENRLCRIFEILLDSPVEHWHSTFIYTMLWFFHMLVYFTGHYHLSSVPLYPL
jgi:hypothetical protein